MQTILQDIDARTNLTSNNQFELLLFRLGESSVSGRSEIFGINVFKVREILPMPAITSIAGSPANVLGVVNIRGQILPVIDLAAAVGCTPRTGLNILMVTEYARSTQAFAVEEVDEIVRLAWSRVLSAEASGGSVVTSIARLDDDADHDGKDPAEVTESRLAQVLDVEQILRNVLPVKPANDARQAVAKAVSLKPGQVILAADDSPLARMMIENGLKAMGAPFIMTKTGKEAWTRLQAMADAAEQQGKRVQDVLAMVLTDLEMPEMDGFTLTRLIKQDARFRAIPVVIHSSLSGSANEEHVRSVGADAYVAKFVLEELSATIHRLLNG